MPQGKCCVGNCRSQSKKHRFPKNETDIFQAWIERIKPLGYNTLSVQQIYDKYLVCDDHFSEDCLVIGTKRGLKRTAVPSLKIPVFHLRDSQLHSAPSPLELTIQPTISSTISELTLYSAPGPSNLVPKYSDIASVVNAIGSTPRNSTRRSILGEVNVSRVKYLSPQARIYYSKIKKWGVQISQLQKNVKSYQERLSNAEKVVKSPNFTNLMKYVNKPSFDFIMCQIRNQKLKPRGRRYLLDEKIMALSLLKASGKGYRFLNKIFALPSSRTLNNVLKRIPFQPGINKHIFTSLKNSVEKMKDEKEKVCILMFDEMAIDTNVSYQRTLDEIVGLEDYGTIKRPVLADHANVFLLKGVFKQWKQPVAFTFSSGPVNTIELKELIIVIIRECFSIGLEVVATVCDQGRTNNSAINMLLRDTREHFWKKDQDNHLFGFLVDDHEVVPLFDVPHMFKGLRNNLLNKNLHFTQNSKLKVAKWAHLQQFHKLDISEQSLRICSKLTDGHVYPEKINKMKVKTCTQVFSHTVGSLMKRISCWDIKDNNRLSKDAEDTADLFLFLDELFDSLNVSRKTKAEAKPMKCIISINL